jgi:hypothetical protein
MMRNKSPAGWQDGPPVPAILLGSGGDDLNLDRRIADQLGSIREHLLNFAGLIYHGLITRTLLPCERSLVVNNCREDILR